MTNSVDLTGYHLTFDAEMTTAADAALFSNTFINGDRTLAPNNEAEQYLDYDPLSKDNPFSFRSGALTITAAPLGSGSLPYTSGLLTTAQTFSQNQGYFEIRAQVPGGKGFWSAFWLLAKDYSSEVDIMEQPNNSGATKYFNSIKTDGLNTGVFQDTGIDISAGYHSYGFLWTSYSIQFSMDGQLIGYPTVTPAGLANSKLYLLANLAVGGYGSWPKEPDPGATAHFGIDYIRVFSNDYSIPAVAQGAISSPDTANMLGTIGTGSHDLVLQFNEDAWNGDAQFTVSIDGVQQGGVFTTIANRAAWQTQSLTIKGDFGAGSHNVGVTFLNDAFGGASNADRNLYLAQASLDGAVIPGSALSLLSNATQSVGFKIAGDMPPYTPTKTLGTGPDTLTLLVNEDAWNGDAQFTISVDGVQQGGVQTAFALRASGATQQFNVKGTFAAGTHTVAVSFINDASGKTWDADRNLYVVGGQLNGVAIPSATLAEYSNGPQSFTFQQPANNTLALGVSVGGSHAAVANGAQYRVLVDGVYAGGTYTATASHEAGLINTQTISGSWGKGAHALGIEFIGTGKAAGSTLYVDSVSYDGAVLPTAGAVAHLSAGSANIAIPAMRTLTLYMAEDRYDGDAQFSLTIDGKSIGPAINSVQALRGTAQALSVSAALSAGTHDVGISFLNDAYADPVNDRNLYMVGAELDGTSLGALWTAGMYSNGTTHFALTVPSP